MSVGFDHVRLPEAAKRCEFYSKLFKCCGISLSLLFVAKGSNGMIECNYASTAIFHGIYNVVCNMQFDNM